MDEHNNSIKGLVRAYNESGADFNRTQETCFFGTEDEIIMHLTFVRGELDQFHSAYERFREMCRTIKYERWTPCDIGPIEDKFFFFGDDSKRLDPPILWDRSKPADSRGNAVYDEWNALMRLSTCAQESLRRLQVGPFYDELRELWRGCRITYDDARQKVGQMTIAPPSADWKYRAGDRID